MARKRAHFPRFWKKPIEARTEDKKTRDLNDIVGEMRSRDADSEWQPTCVGINLSNIQLSDDGSVTNSQIHASLQSLRQVNATQDTFESAFSAFKNEIVIAMKCVTSMVSKPGVPAKMSSCPNSNMAQE